MPLCPEDLIAAAGRADDAVVEDRIQFGGIKHNIKCGKTTHKCTFTADIEEDCSAINSVKISCSPKKTKCSKASATFAAGERDRCLISGTYKNTGKKQSFTGMSIVVNPDYTTTTTTTTTTSTTTEGPKQKDYNCQCIPDFMLYMGQLAMGTASTRGGFMGSCVCVAGMMGAESRGEMPVKL